MIVLKSEDIPLLTDLYQLTMAQCYFNEGHNDTATFSLIIRKYPPNRAFFVSCGLEDVLLFLEALCFTPSNIEKLHKTGIFSDNFLDYLRSFHFTGEVRAIPEGRLFFCDEPVLEVTAPMIEGQIVETYIVNQMNLQCLIATKAARCVHAARGRSVVDFSLRRTHGTDAGMKVARASYIGGFKATSNVLGGLYYDIPLSGTMAHSYISSYKNEIDAFRTFSRNFPDRCILLIETYDAITGAYKAVEVAREMSAFGKRLQGVRIDSGDLLMLGRKVRDILDEAGLQYVNIIGSGNLDEYKLEVLSIQDAPYDSYGIGTKMGVSGDAPWTDMAYKLVSYGNQPVLKLSAGKATLPDAKQVFRFTSSGKMQYDMIALKGEAVEKSEALLQPVMVDGNISIPLPRISEIRDLFSSEITLLDESFKSINNPEMYPVIISSNLKNVKDKTESEVIATELVFTLPQKGDLYEMY